MPSGSSSSSTPWRKSNQLFGIVLTIFLLGLFYYIYSSSWASSIQSDRFTLGFFPLLGVSWMLLAAVMMIFDNVRQQPSGDFAEFTRSSFPWVLTILLGWYLCILAIIQIGFFPAAFAYMCILLRVAGLENWRSIAAIGAISVIVVFMLFRAIGIVLPMGEVWS
jgi:hypothetical protein